MVKNSYRQILLSAWATCFSFMLLYAQPSVKTSVDKNDILIGEQLKVKIEAAVTPGITQLNWLTIPDSLAHFEVVDKTKIDSTYSNGQVTGLAQTITFTSFDSGKWVLPSFKINFLQANQAMLSSVLTDSLLINVSFSSSDTTSQLRDIKPIKEVEDKFPVWYWIAGGVLIIVLLLLLFWLYKRWKKEKPAAIFQSKLSPYDEAMQEIGKLKQLNLSDAADVKIYHSKLAEILKRYLSRKDNVVYLNKTTAEVLILVADQPIDRVTQTTLAASLRCGDAVKFAKFIPEADESNNCLLSVKEIIETLNATNTSLTAAQPKPGDNGKA